MKPNLKNPAYVILYAGATSAFFTAAITTLHMATADIVTRNEKLLTDKALVEIFFGPETLMELSDEQIARLVENRIERESITDPQTGRTIELLLGYRTDQKRELVGYGFDVSGVGFWARIEGVIAVTPDLTRIRGIHFLKHSETPGLGGRITEEQFRGGFSGLDVTAPIEGDRYIYIGGDPPPGPTSPKYRRWVDSITGATGTSTAVNRFLNESIAQFRRAMEASGRLQATGSRGE